MFDPRRSDLVRSRKSATTIENCVGFSWMSLLSRRSRCRYIESMMIRPKASVPVAILINCYDKPAQAIKFQVTFTTCNCIPQFVRVSCQPQTTLMSFL